MKQIWITKYGPPETLEVREGTLPMPMAGEVTVAVKAAGINFADLMARKGLYQDAPRPPCVVGYEVAGVVEAVGSGLDPSWKGKSVFALTRFGGYSEKINLPAVNCFVKPRSLSFEEAAALPVNYLTALILVTVMGGLRRGETVLIHNAGGGVGLAALQIAKHIGAVTIGTASVSKHGFLTKQGLDHPVDYRTGDWVQAVRDLTGGRGVELILDPVGGSFWKKNYRLLRGTGRMGSFGISSASESRGRLAALIGIVASLPRINLLALMNTNRGVFGVNLGHLWKEGEKVHEWTMELLAGVKEGWVRPFVDKTFTFQEAPLAHRYIEERHNRGKVILIP